MLAAQEIDETSPVFQGSSGIERELVSIYWEKHGLVEAMCKEGVDPFVANCKAWAIMIAQTLLEER